MAERDGPVMGQRGLTLVETLAALFIAAVVLGGVSAIFLGATRAFEQSSASAALQRQGTLAVEEIARRARSAAAPSAVTLGCNGRPQALRVNTATGPLCYYAGPAGQLCQDAGAGCRDLLAGPLAPRMPGIGAVRLAAQTAPPDPGCPAAAAGQSCLALDVADAGQGCFVADVAAGTKACVAFAITDGTHRLAFEVAVTCAGRNC